MQLITRGRVAPSPPPKINNTNKIKFVGVYSWNAPKEAIGKERPLTRDEFHQGQAILNKIHSLPHFLSGIFAGRHEYLRKTSGLLTAHRFLFNVFMPRIWPRIEIVNHKFAKEFDGRALQLFSEQAEIYRQLPGMNDRELKQLSMQISSRLFTEYEDLSDQYIAQHDGEQSALFTDRAQQEIYGQIAGIARHFNVRPLHWKKYCKRKMNMRAAFSSIARLVNDEWWVRQFKAQRMQWREALLIAVGEVNLQKSGYASKQAIRDVRARRLAAMEYLKSCDLENVETGERIDLIDKVMGSISNPEIRRMELMSTIAGIEKYAASVGHIGMFTTITTPSKYHPTRQVGAKEKRQVNFNHKWDDAAFSPKDGQRYLVKIWSKMRTAFKDAGIRVYGMRVVEPHHDATPHWHMMLFCDRAQRQAAVDIMRRYALKEDGQERGAQKQRFQCKHMNKGGAASYIAKYIAKNIDGYALDGELDHDTGRPLSETAAAVTAWASTWRIPQFKSIGVPTMGAYRELRRLPRGVSIANEFDELVEAARAAADTGDFAAYISAQGGANVPRDMQTVRTARHVVDELNEYDEEIQKVIGIYAPHLGAGHIHETRTTQWRIVSKAVDVAVHPLNLISASGAPWSPVNNCGEVETGAGQLLPATPPEYTAAVINLIETGAVSWNEPDVAKVLRDTLKGQVSKVNHHQHTFNPSKARDCAPSARMTRRERERMPQIARDLEQNGITPERWELEVLARGAEVMFDDNKYSYSCPVEWPGFDC
ncbi:replication endonuclease [Rahnella sp. FC061912-K]|uniref:replication endonuclease n=1 Tax=Rahnella rivi TaxID=2816249 RepID=UPI001C258A3E|nr:replication endonuclease [Rahnella rivi]MBU9829252.1 replication endonuclease [Rahnella rivi]